MLVPRSLYCTITEAAVRQSANMTNDEYIMLAVAESALLGLDLYYTPSYYQRQLRLRSLPHLLYLYFLIALII